MASRILVGTRKGTFIVEKKNGQWRPRLAGHAGAGVNFVARDPFTGRLWALLGHGHWGAKLSISDDEGKTWKWTRHLEKEPAGSFHYPAIIQAKDGSIHCVYSYFVTVDKAQKKSMKHTRFNEEWVKAGD